MFQFTRAMHYNDPWISVCCYGGALGGLWGALQHFPRRPSLSSLHLYCFSAFPPHFLSSFCSVTLSLLTLPLSLSRTNALSHHCFSSLLSLSLKFFLLSLKYFTFWWTPIFSPSLPLSSPSLMLISVARLSLFVLDF